MLYHQVDISFVFKQLYVTSISDFKLSIEAINFHKPSLNCLCKLLKQNGIFINMYNSDCDKFREQ